MKAYECFAAALLLAGQSLPAGAVVIGVERELTGDIAFTGAADFSGASLHLVDQITYTAAAGEGMHVTFTFASPSSNVTVTPDSHFSVSNLVTTSSSADYDITSIDGQAGAVAIALDRFANVGATLTTGVSAGLHTLTLTHSPSGGVADGSPVSIAYTLPGDWSVAGSATGEHQLLALNPLWTIDSDFLYAGGVTTFAAHIDTYSNNAGLEPGLQFSLIGAMAAAEPPTAWLLLVALVAGVAARRKPGAAATS